MNSLVVVVLASHNFGVLPTYIERERIIFNLKKKNNN